MTKEEINEFSIRISQSTKTELVSITCEITANYINSAIVSLEKKDIPDFRFNIDKAMAFIDDLCSSLDMSYDISYNLISLYMYVKKVLIKSSARGVEGDMKAAAEIMLQIGDSYATVARENMEMAKNNMSMDAGQAIYTGYTYGKNKKLDEYVM